MAKLHHSIFTRIDSKKQMVNKAREKGKEREREREGKNRRKRINGRKRLRELERERRRCKAKFARLSFPPARQKNNICFHVKRKRRKNGEEVKQEDS